jgi:hypothetical protein
MDPDVVRELWIVKDYTAEMASTHVAMLPLVRALRRCCPEPRYALPPHRGIAPMDFSSCSGTA